MLENKSMNKITIGTLTKFIFWRGKCKIIMMKMHYVACKKVINAMEIINVEQGKGDLGSGKKGGVGYSIK